MREMCLQQRGARPCAIFFPLLLILRFLDSVAYSQGLLNLDPTGRSGNAPLLFEEHPSPPPSPLLPPVSTLPTKKANQLSGIRTFVREIKVTGSTIFSPTELATVTNAYVNREVTSGDLEELRLTLTRLYVERSYLNSGAVIPDQSHRWRHYFPDSRRRPLPH